MTLAVTAPDRQLSATPAFAGLPVCATPGCGTILSQYNPDDLCAACASRAPEPGPQGVDLDRLVAGLLLVHSALHGDEALNVGAQLAAMGLAADSWAVQAAVRHAERRHGLVCRGVRGRPGYSVVAWATRYRTAIGAAGVAMERDQDGRWAGVASLLQRSQPRVEVTADQPPLFELDETSSGG